METAQIKASTYTKKEAPSYRMRNEGILFRNVLEAVRPKKPRRQVRETRRVANIVLRNTVNKEVGLANRWVMSYFSPEAAKYHQRSTPTTLKVGEDAAQILYPKPSV